MLGSFLTGFVFGFFGAVMYSVIRYYIDKRKRRKAFEKTLEILKEGYETKVQDFMLRSRKDFIETQNEREPKE